MKNERKQLLVALDYNPSAQKVAEVGYVMAKAMHADVILLHVISDLQYYSSAEYSPIMGFGGFSDPGLLQQNTEALKKTAHQFLDKTKDHLKDNTIKTLVSEGDFAESIIKAANDQRADIIVLGSHSRRWLEDIVMGSVAEKVLRQSSVPVLIIPTNQKKAKQSLLSLGKEYFGKN